ncbi:MAG: zinc dependent phospholipase C family protein [Deltaproteobacteria bacterium]|nr:zinc dependent phospholipase C family protein [Deltaproteobacteria bacterium]
MRPVRIVLVACVLLLVPSEALAWGPAAHIEFGLAMLRDLALLAPALAALLGRFSDDFLYGSIAADITVAKNLSPYHLHCHNWQVGFSVLDLAESDATRAFAWGYLSHLAADTVAHNYFVPIKTIETWQRRATSHAYWEIRFDTRVEREVWGVIRKLSTRAYKEHDRHLRHILTGPLFPFRFNKQIFNNMVLFSRVLQWQRMVEAHARRSRRVLSAEEVEESRCMSLARIADLLARGPQARCVLADPTGHRNLLIARDLRKRLRALDRHGRLRDPAELGALFRPLFREAIEDKLDLPSLLDLALPGSGVVPERASRRRRGLLAEPGELSRRLRAASMRIRRRMRRNRLARSSESRAPWPPEDS